MSVAYAEELEYAPEPTIPRDVRRLLKNIDAANLADQLDAQEIARLGAKVCEEFKVDENSRADWKKVHDEALKLAMQVKEEKSYPWTRAANVKFPLVATAAIQFAARAYPAIVDGSNVVKGKQLGKPDPQKQERSERVAKHMSYQLLDEMPEWEEETDQLLHILPITGTVFRKTYFDPSKGRNVSELITADKLVVNYWAKAEAPRMTQVAEYYPHEITAKVRSGLWLDKDLGIPQGAANDDDAPHQFLEQHRLWDLDGDGCSEPYIVTVHKETEQVVRIVARYDEKGIKANSRGQIYCVSPVEYFTRYRFIPSLDGSYYGTGFGTLTGALNETINSIINQLLDAGHLANTQGGWIGAGITMKSGTMRFQPGEWKRVETPGGLLKDSIVPLPVSPPSTVLFQLLGMLVESAKDITATKDILTGDTTQSNQPVGTTLALIEQGMKVFSAIYKRIHRALKAELGKLYRLNRLYLDPEVYYTFQDQEGVVAQDDYAADDIDVIPVSDPTVVTDMQRIGRAQFLQQFRADPLMDGKEINTRVLEAASISDVESLFAKDQGPPPEVQLEMKKLAQKDRELDLKEREVVVREQEATSRIGKEQADAQKAMTEALGMAPQLAEEVAGVIDARAHDVKVESVHPANVPGMAGSSPDGGVPPVPPGQPGGPEGAMGAGSTPGPEAPDQGAPDGGVGLPGMAGPG